VERPVCNKQLLRSIKMLCITIRKTETFADVAENLNVAGLNIEGKGVSMGSVWADFNNDGYEDLFVTGGAGRNCSGTTAGRISQT